MVVEVSLGTFVARQTIRLERGKFKAPKSPASGHLFQVDKIKSALEQARATV